MRGLFRVSAERAARRKRCRRIWVPTNRPLFPQLLPKRRGDHLHDHSEPEQHAARHGQHARSARRRVGPRDGRAPDAASRREGRARYVPTGHLIYGAGGTLLRRRLRRRSPRSAGRPGRGRKRRSTPSRRGPYEGTLVFQSGTSPVRNHVAGVGRSAGRKKESLETPVRKYGYPRLSPDGTRIALNVMGPPDTDIWMWDVRRKTLESFIDRSDAGTRFSRGAPTDKGWRSAALVSGSPIYSGRPPTAAGSRSGSWKATVFKCPSASRPTAGWCFRLMYRGRGR